MRTTNRFSLFAPFFSVLFSGITSAAFLHAPFVDFKEAHDQGIALKYWGKVQPFLLEKQIDPTEITECSFKNCELIAVPSWIMKALPNVTKINISNNKLITCASLKKLHHLEELDISGNPMYNFDKSMPAFAENGTKIKAHNMELIPFQKTTNNIGLYALADKFGEWIEFDSSTQEKIDAHKAKLTAAQNRDEATAEPAQATAETHTNASDTPQATAANTETATTTPQTATTTTTAATSVNNGETNPTDTGAN